MFFFILTAHLENGNRSAVGETLQNLIQHLIRLAPEWPLAWRFAGDAQVSMGSHGMAIASYCYFLQTSSKSFSIEPDLDDSLIRAMIRCFTHLKNPMKIAVAAQFLSEPDYCIAFQSLQEFWPISNDADDAFFPFICDAVLIEFLLNFYETRGCDSKKQLLTKLAIQNTPDLNPVSLKKPVQLEAKLGFFKLCFYEYCCGGST